jgi:hypothetical protein
MRGHAAYGNPPEQRVNGNEVFMPVASVEVYDESGEAPWRMNEPEFGRQHRFDGNWFLFEIPRSVSSSRLDTNED